MKSRFFTIVKPLLFLLVASLLCGLPATAFSSGYNSDELTTRIKSGGYLQKTDNLMIILDGTGEQGWLGRETEQVQIGRALIQNIGATIPNIPHRRMLRVFGPTADRFQEDFSTIFGLYHTSARDYTPIIATKTHPISDNDPLELTFFSAISDLKKIEGTHAIILISRADRYSKAAIAQSAYLKKAFGDSICYYPIYLGTTPKSEAKMQQFARIGGCGRISTYADVDTPEELTNFVESVFFAKKKSYKPAQPVIPVVEEPVFPEADVAVTVMPAVIEDPYEPELIADIIEETPEPEISTGSDVIILERQLPHDKVVTIELHVEFDLNKATVKDEFKTDIQKVADFMIQYPETEVLLEGHTCSLGSDKHNMILSKKRAEAVQNALNTDFAIAAERIKTRGAGESEPIADNTTEEGRVRNRRVMAVISTIVTDFIIIEQEISKEEFLRDDFVLPPIEQSIQEQIQVSPEPEGQMSEPTVTEDVTQIEEFVFEETPEENGAPVTMTTPDTDMVPDQVLEFEVTEDDGAAVTSTTIIEDIEPAPANGEDVVVTEGEAAFDETEEKPLTVTTDN